MLTAFVTVWLQMTQNEARGGVLRLVVAGGRAQEKPGASGAVAVGVRTLSEGGAVGGFSREQVDFLCHLSANWTPKLATSQCFTSIIWLTLVSAVQLCCELNFV